MHYRNQSVLLASKHEKEKAIAVPFMTGLSCTVKVHDFDTDQFGTFTGEVPRTQNPYQTCLLKARTAAERFNYACCVASEGSFGPHPSFPFVPNAHELMVFIDRDHQWIIAEQLVSQKTNYAMIKINENSDINNFLKRVLFPSHALILQGGSDNRVVAKGIKDFDVLMSNLSLGFKTEKELLLVTDMRAMMNPTRMKMIGELADKLVKRIATPCPQCACPGFGFKSTQGSLPCDYCGSSTSFYKEEIWGCITCTHQEYKMRKDGLLKADPTFCDYCNP